MSRILLLLSGLLAFVVMVLGFDVFDTTGDPHLFGWVGATLFALIASQVVSE